MIARNPSLAAGQAFDLIIVGGGFYGASLALESARRGLKPLLLEAGDFRHATRIVCESFTVACVTCKAWT